MTEKYAVVLFDFFFMNIFNSPNNGSYMQIQANKKQT